MSFMEILQPGLKYLREERDRQRMHVAYPTNGADPLMEIDLDAGTATIVVPASVTLTTDSARDENLVPARSEQPDRPGETRAQDEPSEPDELSSPDQHRDPTHGNESKDAEH